MNLSPEEATSFLKLWAHLDAYTNQRLGLLPDVKSPRDLSHGVSVADRGRLRVAFWEDPSLLKDFIRTNPFGLSADEMEDVGRFRHAVRGRFFVERCLKDHAVLVAAGEQRAVYAVIGLTEPIDEFLARRTPMPLPILVEAALVPFRGRITWDGLVSFHSIHFGPGIRRDLKDEYLRAKDRGEIIGSLDAGPRPMARRKRVVDDGRPALEKVVAAADAVGRPDTSLQAAAFRLLKASAHLALLSVAEPDKAAALEEKARKAERALRAVHEALLRDSE
ncbi:MAG: hypothetical protein AB2A00_06520 [Myxococcota bacterium]